jgi:DNA-directed RNA polymerase subunit RPC12/RpoP
MVGIQCKSCGHRALVTPQQPMSGYEMTARLHQSPPKCSECGDSNIFVLTFTASRANEADSWLKG